MERVIKLNPERRKVIMERVEKKVEEKSEQKANPKVLFCLAGVRQFAVPEKFILFRNGFEIKANQVFVIDIIPSPVSAPGRAPVLNLNLGALKNAVMNCSFICDLAEEDPIYKGVVEVMAKVMN